MSKTDQVKWDERYRAGAFAERPHPSALLESWVSRLAPGRALDLACGAGRNSLFLARHGFAVTGIDIASEGLKRAAASAKREGLNITWLRHDLDAGLPASGPFEVVCLFRYVNPDLIRRLPGLLAPNGILLVEEHLATDQPVAGPSNPAFCVQPGELRRLLPKLEVLHQEEGIITDPDGRPVAIARLVGQFGGGAASLRAFPSERGRPALDGLPSERGRPALDGIPPGPAATHFSRSPYAAIRPSSLRSRAMPNAARSSR